MLLHSAAKPMAMCEALACEQEARGDALRAAVLCDTERGPRQPEGSPLALGGGARALLAAVAADDRLAPLRPALVTGETFAVRGDGCRLVAAALVQERGRTWLARGAALRRRRRRHDRGSARPRFDSRALDRAGDRGCSAVATAAC